MHKSADLFYIKMQAKDLVFCFAAARNLLQLCKSDNANRYKKFGNI